MLTDTVRRNYLSRLAFSNDDREQPYHKTNLVVRALCPIKGMRSFAVHKVRIVSINEAGAIVQARDIAILPEHFYLCLGKSEIFLTCSRVSKGDGSLFVRFSKPESSAFIQALTRISFPLTTLEQLRGNVAQAIETRIRHGAKATEQ